MKLFVWVHKHFSEIGADLSENSGRYCKSEINRDIGRKYSFQRKYIFLLYKQNKYLMNLGFPVWFPVLKLGYGYV